MAPSIFSSKRPLHWAAYVAAHAKQPMATADVDAELRAHTRQIILDLPGGAQLNGLLAEPRRVFMPVTALADATDYKPPAAESWIWAAPGHELGCSPQDDNILADMIVTFTESQWAAFAAKAPTACMPNPRTLAHWSDIKGPLLIQVLPARAPSLGAPSMEAEAAGILPLHQCGVKRGSQYASASAPPKIVYLGSLYYGSALAPVQHWYDRGQPIDDFAEFRDLWSYGAVKCGLDAIMYYCPKTTYYVERAVICGCDADNAQSTAVPPTYANVSARDPIVADVEPAMWPALYGLLCANEAHWHTESSHHHALMRLVRQLVATGSPAAVFERCLWLPAAMSYHSRPRQSVYYESLGLFEGVCARQRWGRILNFFMGRINVTPLLDFVHYRPKRPTYRTSVPPVLCMNVRYHNFAEHVAEIELPPAGRTVADIFGELTTDAIGVSPNIQVHFTATQMLVIPHSAIPGLTLPRAERPAENPPQLFITPATSHFQEAWFQALIHHEPPCLAAGAHLLLREIETNDPHFICGQKHGHVARVNETLAARVRVADDGPMYYCALLVGAHSFCSPEVEATSPPAPATHCRQGVSGCGHHQCKDAIQYAHLEPHYGAANKQRMYLGRHPKAFRHRAAPPKDFDPMARVRVTFAAHKLMTLPALLRAILTPAGIDAEALGGRPVRAYFVDDEEVEFFKYATSLITDIAHRRPLIVFCVSDMPGRERLHEDILSGALGEPGHLLAPSAADTPPATAAIYELERAVLPPDVVRAMQWWCCSETEHRSEKNI